MLELKSGLSIAKILRVFVGVAEIIVDEDGGLAGELETLAALVAGDEVVQANHVGCGSRKLAAVLLAGASGEFPLLTAHLPAYRRLEFAATARADKLDLASLFFFRIKAAFVHLSSTIP